MDTNTSGRRWDGTVVEASIAQLRDALDSGAVTSVELVTRYLNRIGAYDRTGLALNSVSVLNPGMFEVARASDERRSRGATLSGLEGIPYTAKESYKVRGLPVTAGSPAFENLVANDDAFVVGRLRSAGAVLVGLTNMPPMANGGPQRGVHGRSESVYNPKFSSSAYGSGSSNGSGTATAASLASFGLGEETWSSGRAPASNNGLVAYTPSRGVISVRGNWPLVPTMDVIVPHTRTVADLLEILEIIVVEDPDDRGDLWRMQEWVSLPSVSEVRPKSYLDLEPDELRGRRFGVPRIYINEDPNNADPITTRDTVMLLWERLRTLLQDAGATVVPVSFPVVERYERLHRGDETMVDRGLVPGGFETHEVRDLSIWAWDDFLKANGQPGLDSLADVPAHLLAPGAEGTLPDRFGEHDYELSELVEQAREGVVAWNAIPDIEAGMRGLERTRQVDFEDWLQELGLDAVIFPAAADVASSDADTDVAAADRAWKNGVWVSNGNLVPRHLGIPTVTLPMGVMQDTGMPVGVTVAGPAYTDTALLQLALAIEGLGCLRMRPALVPPLDSEMEPLPVSNVLGNADNAEPWIRIAGSTLMLGEDEAEVTIWGHYGGLGDGDIVVCVDGERVPVAARKGLFEVQARRPAMPYKQTHSAWRGPYEPTVTVVAGGRQGLIAKAVWGPDRAPFLRFDQREVSPPAAGTEMTS